MLFTFLVDRAPEKSLNPSARKTTVSAVTDKPERAD
jgi:hypothetical protein